MSVWEAFKEIAPKAILTTTVILIFYGFFWGVKTIFKDEIKRRADKKSKEDKGGKNVYQ